MPNWGPPRAGTNELPDSEKTPKEFDDQPERQKMQQGNGQDWASGSFGGGFGAGGNLGSVGGGNGNFGRTVGSLKAGTTKTAYFNSGRR